MSKRQGPQCVNVEGADLPMTLVGGAYANWRYDLKSDRGTSLSHPTPPVNLVHSAWGETVTGSH